MRLSPHGCCLVALFLLGPGEGLHGQAILSGVIQDDSTSERISGAEVLIEIRGRRTLTDSEGRYVLMGLPAGSHNVLVRAVGYVPRTVTIRAVAGQVVRSDLRLVPAPIRLDPVEVTGRMPRPRGIGLEGLEDRRRLGFGRFVDSAVLRDSEHFDLVTVLRRAGVEISEKRAVGRRGCPMQVYIDGILYRDPPNLDFFSVAGLAGVEAYMSTAQVPSEYAGLDQFCGVLLLWTRRVPLSRRARGGAERALSLRIGKEVQEVPRRGTVGRSSQPLFVTS